MSLNFIPRPVHGLIFLFKWKPGEEPTGPIVHESRSLGIFFAKQVSKKLNTTMETKGVPSNFWPCVERIGLLFLSLLATC